MKIVILISSILLLSLVAFSDANPYLKEYVEVKAAVLDYVEGIYNMEVDRIRQSVHPDLAKLGFFPSEGKYREAPMTQEQMLKAAATYNKDGRIPKDAIKDVVVFEVLDQTAAAKAVCHWGIDYIHLAKFEGKWKIIHVLWQTFPPSK